MANSYIFLLSDYCGGGTETVFTQTAQALMDQGAIVYLFVINGFDSSKYKVAEGIKNILSFSELKKTYKKESCNVVNFSGNWKTSFYARRLSRKYISWVHCNPLTMRTARTWFINFYLLKKSSIIVCVCKEQKEILQEQFHFKNKIKVIYNSVDLKKIESLSKEPLPEYMNKKYILMCARFDFKSKDFFTLIDAYNLLSAEIKSQYNLVLLGDGADKGIVEAYCKDKKLGSVIFPGYDSNPFKWMKNASCFILSSKTEGFSLVPVEAFGCGCPTVLTKYHTGSQEISDNGKNAILVEIGNKKEMSNAINTILTNKEIRNKLVSNSSEFIIQFNIENFQNKIQNLFEIKND